MSLAETATAGVENSEEFQTFDSFSEEEVAETSSDDDWSKDPEEGKEKVKDDLKVIKDSQLDHEGKVIKDKEEKEESDEEEESEEEEEEKEEDKEEDEEESEEKEEEKEKEEKAKSDAKKLRMRMGDELFNVNSDATFKVKVDGELQEVPIQELINNYAGKTAWDKKFTEIGKEKKALEKEVQMFSAKQQKLNSIVQEVVSNLEDAEKNPMDALLYLVEMSGKDPYNSYRRMMEANLDELANIMDMTETERELYFHKKKDELHSSVAKKRQEVQLREQRFNQAVQKVDQLRQSFNVSEDDFVDASEELESIYEEAGLDVNNITEEVIVDYASLRPHISKVKELIAPYEDNISEQKYGDVVANLSRYLRDGKADEAAIKEILKRNYSVEEDVKELNSKVYQKAGKKPASKVSDKAKSDKLETFDDWT